MFAREQRKERKMSVRNLFRVVLAVLALGMLGLLRPLQADSKPVNPDEELLREAKIGTDGPGLLAFFRERTPADEDLLHPERLLQQLASPSFDKREEASRKLIRLERLALPLVRQAESDQDAEVARRAKDCALEIGRRVTEGLPLSAVRLLGRQRADGGAEVLLRYLPIAADEETVDEIWHVVEGEIETRGKLPQGFVAALRDALPARRALAACVVARFGDAEQRASVRSLLTDADSAVRLRAAQGLLAKNDPAGVSALIPLLEDRSRFIAWQAEELLRWVAGDSAPDTVVGSAEAARQCRDEWDKWWEAENGNLGNHLSETKRGAPGLLLVCEEGDAGTFRLWLCGCDGKARWELGGVQQVVDVQLTPQETVLLAEDLLLRRKGDDSRGRFSEVTLAGKRVWEKVETVPTFAIRQSSGGEKVAMSGARVQVLDARGKEIASHGSQATIYGARALQRVGNRFRTLSWDQGESGSVLRDGWMDGRGPRTETHIRSQARGRTLQIIGEDRLLLLEPRVRVVELKTNGEVLWECRNPRIKGAVRLRGAATVTWCDLPPRILLVDGRSRVVWEAYARREVHLVAGCLPLVRFGFERVETLDDLGSVANRIKALKHKDAVVRAGAALALAEVGEKARQAIPALVETLGDKDQKVREAARSALVPMGTLPLAELRKALKHEWPQVRAGAVPLVAAHWKELPAVIPELVAAARDQDPSVRAATLLFLSEMWADNREVIPLLIQGLKDEHPEVCQATAAGLCREGNPKLRAVIPALIAALNKKDEKIRFSAAVALGKIGPQTEDVIPALIEALNESSPSRDGAVRALGEIGPPAKDAVPALIKVLQSSGVQDGKLVRFLQVDAAFALGQIGPGAKMAVPVLAEMVQDRKVDSVARATIAETLGKMGNAAKAAVPALAATLREPPTRANLALLESVAGTLEKLGASAAEAIPVVQMLASDPKHPLNEFFSDLLVKLKAATGKKGANP
jgi:HEAT repeat protein